MAGGAALKLVFFGTPEFAVPSLAALAESRYPIVGVVSQPERPRGRGRSLEPTPVGAEARRWDLPLLQREKVGSPEALDWLRSLAPDLGVVVAFGQFIPRTVRELPRLQLINAHASLLPRWRGAAPIPHAILAGDPRTGISVMRVERAMDAGDVCLVRETEIGAEETAGELSERLAALAAEALLEAVDALAEGIARFVPQAHEHATLAPKLSKEFGEVDWTRPRDEILRRIRAATPWPGVDLALKRSGARVRLLGVRAAEGPPGPARRVAASDGRLRVAAVDGWIEGLRLQAPGKRPVDAAEYLRGARVPDDEEVDDA